MIEIEREEAVAFVYLNRPEAYNAVSYGLIAELCGHLENLDRDPAIRVIVLAGRGKAFCAGADVKEMKEETSSRLLERDPFFTWERLRHISKPLIACVHGYALGGGLELALCCDIIVAAEGTQLGQPEILLGIIPGAGGTQRLTRIIGKYKAMELILTGRRLHVLEALALGLVNKVVPPESLINETRALAELIAGHPPLAVKNAKAAIGQAQDLSLEEGLRLERQLFYLLFSTKDQKEGMQAFMDKRQAQFKGE